jgi:hypothetical protein
LSTIFSSIHLDFTITRLHQLFLHSCFLYSSVTIFFYLLHFPSKKVDPQPGRMRSLHMGCMDGEREKACKATAWWAHPWKPPTCLATHALVCVWVVGRQAAHVRSSLGVQTLYARHESVRSADYEKAIYVATINPAVSQPKRIIYHHDRRACLFSFFRGCCCLSPIGFLRPAAAVGLS